jgi:hypothetical protein
METRSIVCSTTTVSLSITRHPDEDFSHRIIPVKSSDTHHPTARSSEAKHNAALSI